MNDPIVEEVRRHRQAHAARYNNDLSAICKALQAREQSSGRVVVNRAPRLVPRKGGTQQGAPADGLASASLRQDRS